MCTEIVNGYVCHNCSEVALAKQGKDPSVKPGDPPDGSKADKSHKGSAFDKQPATILDGALSKLLAANPVTAASASTTPASTTWASATSAFTASQQSGAQSPLAPAVDISV